MKKTKSVLRAAAAAGVAVAGSGLCAGVYIAPSNLEDYKAKTDQVGVDYYVNKDSFIGGGANAKVQEVIRGSGIRFDDALAAGDTTEKPKASIMSGTFLKSGSSAVFYLPTPKWKKPYVLKMDEEGSPHLMGIGSDGKATISLKGDNAIDRGGIYCISSGKNGCLVYAQDRIEAYYNIFSGQYREVTAQYAANRVCHDGRGAQSFQEDPKGYFQAVYDRDRMDRGVFSKTPRCGAPEPEKFKPHMIKGIKTRFVNIASLARPNTDIYKKVREGGRESREVAKIDSGRTEDGFGMLDHKVKREK